MVGTCRVSPSSMQILHSENHQYHTMNTPQILPLCFISWLSMHAATVLELGEGGPESWTTGLDYSTVFARQNDTLARSDGF